MGNTQQMEKLRAAERLDAVPIASQIKSAALALHGDTDAAAQTQLHFTRRCPVVSQVRSLVEAVQGDTEAAEDTQRDFLDNASRQLDIIPVVGHAKGKVHAVLGDDEAAARSSTEADESLRTVVAGTQAAGRAVATGAGVAAGVAAEAVAIGAEAASAMVHRTAAAVDELLRRASSARSFDDATLLAAAEGKTVCGICLEEVEQGAPLRVLQCFHCFHPECAQKWWKQSNRCAVCRTDVVPQRQKQQQEDAPPERPITPAPAAPISMVVGVPSADGPQHSTCDDALAE